ncbi:major membrane immunogen (membrane-anchored lipoprotein) [Lactobacillus colini]|uniref:Major membrane immunogen (Membrane-anchored lipoprotein) n=1 Tax=Lactobacillus colini TaxID=1819254 RepID=A0ABS4MDH3_9LACO|nr:hypothetical protein [Lactobacillus colini]MBP2057738.1 major membrane immunogen (membrane-anchored lipoprotein) [Lactobacillus colini]
MKKQFGIATVIAALILTVGCQKSASSNNSSSENSSRSSIIKKSSSTSSDKSNASSSSTSSSQSSSQKSSLKGSQAPTSKKSRFAKINAEIAKKFPSLPLPRTSGLDMDSNTINARYSKNNNQVTIYYSVGNKAKAVNDPSLNKELPYLVYSQISNLDSAELDSRINYQNQASGLPTVKLNDGITATEQSGAGQRYLTWNKDNWSFTVHASAVNNQDPKPIANKLIALLNSYKLPQMDKKAAITITVGEGYGSLNNQMYFQKDGKLYHLQAHSLKTMLKMASTIR